MDISDKIKKIRENNNLTQNEFAKMLFVSRTAVSKWELKKGYPSIESLKLISKNFNVSLDELLSGSDMISIANEEIESNKKKNKLLIRGIIDIMSILVFLLPLFAMEHAENIVCLSFFSIEFSTLRFVLFCVVLSALIAVGVLEIIALKINNELLSKTLMCVSFLLGILSLALFIMCKQMYASVFMLGLLVVKGFFEIKTK